MSGKHLVVIDGLSFLFRAYHAVRPLNRKDGLPTNALYGFSQMLLKVVDELQPDLCVVALDSIKPTFRKEMYPEYKAHREEPDEEIKQQMPYMEPLAKAFGIKAIRVEGVEADDIIATLATQHEGKVTIVSSDKDLMQLINKDVVMLDTMKGRLIDEAGVKEKFGVLPAKVIDAQALIGDSADNVPGVKGIGPKTAAQLLNEFGSLDGIYANVDKIPREKLRVSLVEERENAELSKKLVTLKCDVELNVSEDLLSFCPEIENAVNYLEELEFYTLSRRLKAKNSASNASGRLVDKVENASISAVNKRVSNYECVVDEKRLDEILSVIKKVGVCGFDTETTSLNAIKAEIVGISLAWGEGEACYIPLTHRKEQGDLLGSFEASNMTQQLEKYKVFEKLTALWSKSLLTDGIQGMQNVRIVGQNLKYDFEILRGAGVELPAVYDDTLLMSYCLEGGLHGHGLDELARMHFEHEMIKYKDVCGTGKSQITFDLVDLDKATQYAAEDADFTLRIYNLLKDRFAATGMENVKHLYENVEKPLLLSLVEMERSGIKVDRGALEKLSFEFAQQIEVREKRIHEIAGEIFNVNSPKQLSEILFDKMGLTIKGKRPKSTNVAVLEALAEQDCEIASEVIVYRQLSKLRSTYSEALVGVINHKTGRVHTSYNQAGAATGRFSSSDPNLQNIPIRTENGRKIRRAFIAEKGCILLAADYSQAELRLLAHFSGSESLIEAFKQGRDIHTHTAAMLFDVPLESVDKEQRRLAKVINFGLVYGMGAMSVARQVGIERKEASAYIERYFERYSGIREYMDRNIEFAREHGYVETLMGRRVHLPEINSKNGMLKAGAERAAINAPLQGSNADVIKKAMPIVERALKEKGLKAKMLLQVHDELVFEVPEDELEIVRPLVKELMENVVELKVPMKVDTGVGYNWEDAH